MSRGVILAVDDDADTLALIEEILGEQGFEVCCANSGPDALSVLLSRPIDLVLLDIRMPDMNGFAVLELIRFIPRLMYLPVIVQTATPPEEQTERAGTLGACAVLSKPVSPARLIEEVERHLGKEDGTLKGGLS